MINKHQFIPKKLGLFLTASLITGLMAGCAAVHKEVDDAIVLNDQDTSKIVKIAHMDDYKVVSKVKKSWVSESKPLPEVAQQQRLPLVFQSNFMNNTPGTVKVLEVLSRVAKEKGVQIRLSDELNAEQSMVPFGNGTANQQYAGSSTNIPSLPGMPMSLPGATGQKSTGASGMMVNPNLGKVNDLVYNGTLAGFLDILSNKMQASWKYENDRVLIYRYETRVFNIKALAGSGSTINGVTAAQSTSSSAGASGTSGSSTSATGTTSGNQTELTLKADLWKSVNDSVKVMLSSYGQTNFFASADLGTITITDTPAKLDKVGSYISGLNKDLGKQVSLQIAIYSIDLDNNDTVGIDWNIAFGSSQVGSTGGGAGTTNTTGLITAGASILTGPWSNSKFAIGALNKVGKTSVVTQGQLITMNRQTAPLQIMSQTNYLASISTTVTGSSGTSQTSLTPGSVVTGFSAYVTPKIEEDGDILVQFASGISDLKAINTYSSGGQTIQLPQTITRDFLQRVKLKSGQTMVLTGFEQATSQSKDSGVGNAKNIFTGGQQYADKNKSVLVIMITPFLVE